MSENKRVTIPFLEKVLKPIVDLIRTKADKTDILQSDWNQADETQIDFIKNKPEGLAYTSDIPVVDVTLSTNGAVADAKATGDAIGAVSELVGDVAVATQITDAIATIPQSDWNQSDTNVADYVKNRTHYDAAHSVAWDGDTSGHVLAEQNKTYANKQIKLVKVSGMTPTPEELVSAGAKVTNSEANRTGTSWATDTTTTFSGANYANENGWECCSEDGGFLVAYKAGYQYVYVAVAGTIELTYTMPEPGIYFVLFEQRSTPRTKCTKLEWRDLKQLDDKYIPDTIARVSDIIQADWNETDETSLAFIQNKPIEETEDDAIDMLAEMGILDPVTDEENNILTDEDGNIFTIE